MIRIARGEECVELPGVRLAELARIEAILRTGRRPGSRDFGDEYKCVRGTLRERQLGKCCYCEKFAEAKYATVEHVRPKAEARRSDGRVERGYWWLAWTWDNLLFCCPQCNRHKDIWFPLRGDDQLPHRGRPLAERNDPPGHERPILLDPAVDDGIAHIQFRLIAGRWVPHAREGSRRGYETIRITQLDRSDLLELYCQAADCLQDSIDRISDTMTRAGQPPSVPVREVWREVLGRQLHPRVLAGLHYDMFDHYFPRQVRLRWGVSLDEFAAALTRRRTGA